MLKQLCLAILTCISIYKMYTSFEYDINYNIINVGETIGYIIASSVFLSLFIWAVLQSLEDKYGKK